MFFTVKVKPNSMANQVVVEADGSLQLKLKAVAANNKANIALIAYLSTLLNIPKSEINIVSGFTSRIKRIEINAEPEIVMNCLLKIAIKR